MKEIKAPQKIDNSIYPLIFLGGSIEMGTAENWQIRLVKHFENSNVTFLNPRRDDWDSSWIQSKDNPQFRQQVEWELNALEESNIIVFYLDPNTKSPITLLEIGLYARNPKQPVIVCCPDGFYRKGNIEIVCERYNIKLVNTFSQLVIELEKNLLKYTFFWNGVFSQWYPSKFKVHANDIEMSDFFRTQFKHRISFCTAEQYMMFCKACLFDDYENAVNILATDDPKEQKAFGRIVQNFDKDVWESKAKEIVYAGNYAKFTQNAPLLMELFATSHTLLVEASPYDCIWGIGLDEQTAKKTPPEQWKGTNWLGEVLTKLRQDLKKDLTSN